MRKLEDLENRINKLEYFKFTHNHLGLWCAIVFLIVSLSLTLIYSFEIKSGLSYTDYCHEKYGQDSWYDFQKNKPFEVRSCDSIDENGTLVVKYFVMADFNRWKESKK